MYKWQARLTQLIYPFDESTPTIERINEVMQKEFPGDYQVEEYFDKERLIFSLKLVFVSPEEESMFVLKYSNK